MSPSSSCAATTTIREALAEYRIKRVFWKNTLNADLNTDEGCQQAAEAVTAYLEMVGVPAAVASLEQLVEAAQATIAGVERDLSEWLEDDGDGTVDGFAYFIRLRAALAAVGPGLIVGKHPKTDDGDTVALHD